MAHELYLTYQEYKSYGGELSETAFIPLEFKSRKRIDYLTDSRVQNMIAVPAAVKLPGIRNIRIQLHRPSLRSIQTDTPKHIVRLWTQTLQTRRWTR